jgi:transposase-like protein
MTHLTEQKLLDIVELMGASATASFVSVAAAAGISESLLYNWREKCERARLAEDFSSPFYITYRDEKIFWTTACARARREHLMTSESIIRSQSATGIIEPVRDGNGNIVYRKNPDYLGRSDTWISLIEGGDEADAGYYRILRDADGNPIPETKVTHLPAQLRLRVLEASNDEYRSKQVVDVNVSGDVVHHLPPPEREPGEPRIDVAELRRIAKLSPKARRAEFSASAYPTDADGRRTIPLLSPPLHKDSADDAGNGLRPPQPAYVPPRQPPTPDAGKPRPSYARPVKSLDRGEHTGRGEPPDGGYKVS